MAGGPRGREDPRLSARPRSTSSWATPRWPSNIPLAFQSFEWDPDKKGFHWDLNPEFLPAVQAWAKPGDTLLVSCRSGGRSAMAINLLARPATPACNILDGMEGGQVKDPDSVFDGMRMKNGWKNSGLPWTYEIDPAGWCCPRARAGARSRERARLSRARDPTAAGAGKTGEQSMTTLGTRLRRPLRRSPTPTGRPWGSTSTPQEAFEMWKADPEHVHILDVRTFEEYIFVGHVEMAKNIPLVFPRYDPAGPSMPGRPPGCSGELNPDFVPTAKERSRPPTRSW